jgi:hypothetical protein
MRKSNTGGAAAGVAALGALLVALAVAPGAGAATYYACVKKKTGAIRLVARSARCRRSERKISFNSEGPRGRNGLNGRNGKNGTNGTNGANGANGTNGANGATGFTTTLPKGQTEQGTWGAIAPNPGSAYSAISFNIPLATAPATLVTEATGEPPPPACPGTFAKPTAASGQLCIYINTANITGSVDTVDPVTLMFGAETFGTLVKVTNGTANGSWAVTG